MSVRWGAMLAAIMFFWVADREFALEAVNTGREKKIGAWFLVLGKYVLVPLAFVALVSGALLGGIGYSNGISFVYKIKDMELLDTLMRIYYIRK